MCSVSSVVVYLFMSDWLVVLFFKQKTAYEMRISDWSSDVCSSDLYGLDRAVERGKLTPENAEAAAARLAFSADADAAVAQADLVIEAVPESIKLKVELFGRWDGLAPEHSILASNTSGLSIAAMAAATTRPEKVIGWH